MRHLSPAFIVTSLALAIASGSAFAQTSGAGLNRTSAAPTTGTAVAPPTNSGNSTSPTGSSGSCVGSNGSTCTSSTTPTSSSNTTATSPPSETLSASNVTAPVSNASAPTTTQSSSGSASNTAVTSAGSAGSAAANGAFRITPNNPGATPTGVALGQSPGQTSSGTLAGNSSSGLGVTGNDVFNRGPGTATSAGGMNSGLVVPGVATIVDTGMNANGERTAVIINNNPAANANQAATPTPLFELTARQGAAKEAARRAQGIEPRVYGIAPRTDRDLTHQMPDDPVIRY